MTTHDGNILRNAFLERFYALADEGEIDSAIELLFDECNELAIAGEWASYDRLVESFDEQRLCSYLLVAILSITFLAQEHLLSRPAFFEKAKTRLHDLGKNAPRILRGLEQK